MFTRSSSAAPYAAGLLAIAIWAAIPSVVKVALQGTDISLFLLLRFMVPAPCFLLSLSRLRKKLMPGDGRRFVALGLVLGLNYTLQTHAMNGLPASWYIVIFSLSPIISLMVLKTRLSRTVSMLVATAVVGTLLFVPTGETFQTGSFLVLRPHKKRR
jgi:drug/metabolite transporter (DMT)-like permease